MKLDINPEWNYAQALGSIEALKTQYKSFLVSFSVFEHHQKVLFMSEVKKQIYSFKFEKWRSDKLWRFMNDEIDFLVLITSAKKRQKQLDKNRI